MRYKNCCFKMGNDLYRLLWEDPVQKIGWAIKLEDRSAWPITLSQGELNNISPLENATSLDKEARISDSMKILAETCHGRIQTLIEDVPEIFSPPVRRRLIEARAKELGCSTATLYANLRRYWQRGQTKAALYGRYAQRP